MLRLSNTPVALLTGWPSTSLSAASRWLSSAVALFVSSRMAVVLPSATVTVPVSSLARVDRWMVPRLATVVVAISTPACVTVWPVKVMSPAGAVIRPVLTTVPAVLSALREADTSLPAVVERRLPSVPTPLRMVKLSPAASTVWPEGVWICPALRTSLPSSST